MDFISNNYFTIGQLMNNYFHTSSLKSNSNYSFKKYLLGFYYNISIVNIFYVVFFLKNLISFILTISLKNGKILMYSDLIEQFYYKPKLSWLFCFLGVSFYFQKWRPGFLITLKKKKLFTRYIKIFKIPDLILVGPTNNKFTPLNIFKESKKLSIIMFAPVDSSYNLFLFNYFTIINYNSSKSNFFYFKIIESLLIKLFFIKKSFFCAHIINKF